VLRTLGLQRRQVSAISLWQITTITGLALLVGLPIGTAAGHWAWTLFAGVLGISPGTAIPVAAGLAIIPAGLLAAQALALWAALDSAKTRPAEMLRAE
jgi:predicted lysophospholipase L1 biosynthesis ABC-type transport system permease subunit